MARIALIDDEAELRLVLAEILESAGHQVLPAPTGEAGLDLVRREHPDVVVCDVNMPGLDGFGVLRALRSDERTAAIPFLFLSSEVQVRAGMASGADDYLLKPVHAADLLAAVDARIRRAENASREAGRRADEVRRTVAALLPHELRTPLTTILGAAHVLKDLHADLAPGEIAEMAAGILKAGERLHRMAENYILYADLEMARLAAAPPSIALRGLSRVGDVREAAAEVAAEAARPGDLDLQLEAAEVHAAPVYVRKVVSEIVHNAFAYSAPGTRVEVALRATADHARLEVSDRGRGLTPEQAAEIAAFRQFERGRFEQQGSGVGLALVRSIVDAAGGRLQIESRRGGGTTVLVHWPG